MASKEAIKLLKSIGFTGRNGNGSHYVMSNCSKIIVISNGHKALSKETLGKVNTALRRIGKIKGF